MDERGHNGNGFTTAAIIGLFLTVLGMSIGVALWVGALHEQIKTNTAWIAERRAENIPARLATVEARQADVRAKLEHIEREQHEHQADDNRRFRSIDQSDRP